MNDKKNDLISKICLFVLIISYFIYFIYSYITTDYDFNNKVNLFKLMLFFVALLGLGLTIVTNKSVSLFFNIFDFIIILFLIGLTIMDFIPKEEKEESKETSKEVAIKRSITCSYDNTKIDVTYTNNNINNIIYTYTYPLGQEDKLNNEVLAFNEKYQDTEAIYGEININDDITLTYTYNIDDIDINKYKDIIDNKLLYYDKLHDEELYQMTCVKAK